MKIKTFLGAVMATIGSIALASGANAALIGNATTINGGMIYEGLGETSPGSGIGTGRWAIGDCSFDGTATSCVISGTYEEDATSTNDPGATGSYVMTYTYLGTTNPGIAQSIAPGSNQLTFQALGDALFTLELMPSTGGTITGFFPDIPFSNSIGFGVEHDGATQSCLGLPTSVACTVGTVGLNAGSSLSATAFSTFGFSIPDSILDTSEVPLPAALPFFIAGLAGMGVTARKKKSKEAV